ncbi:MAG TPA: hypothetical protein VG759_20105 [Candidatus Angelobacter sp.]|jgi:hypothetical protein|nr:hypothetical protein [Candidatus Angelobacter sp.]
MATSVAKPYSGLRLSEILTNFAGVFNSEIPASKSEEHEEVLVRYTHGRGRTSSDKKFITLKMYMYKASGEPDGWHEGVWQRLFKDPSELLKPPDPPTPPLDQPQGPVPNVPPLAYTKGIWTFGDDSSVTAIGPAMSRLMPLDDKSGLFMVTCAQIITNGTLKYDGARGLKTSLGSTWSDKNIFTEPGEQEFEARTIDTFRIIRQENHR